MQAIDEIVPTLLHALEGSETSDIALDGLKQILSVRAAAILPHILPKLVQAPPSAFNVQDLGALAEVAGPGLNFHLRTILAVLLSAMGDSDMDLQQSAKKAAETVVLVIDEDGIESLISELLKVLGENQASIRRGSSHLVGYFFKNSKLYLDDEAPNMISTLIVLLSDSDQAVVGMAWEALSRVVGSLSKEVLPSYIKLVHVDDLHLETRSVEKEKSSFELAVANSLAVKHHLGLPNNLVSLLFLFQGGILLIPGLCLPKALQPLLPVFLQV